MSSRKISSELNQITSNLNLTPEQKRNKATKLAFKTLTKKEISQAEELFNINIKKDAKFPYITSSDKQIPRTLLTKFYSQEEISPSKNPFLNSKSDVDYRIFLPKLNSKTKNAVEPLKKKKTSSRNSLDIDFEGLTHEAEKKNVYDPDISKMYKLYQHCSEIPILRETKFELESFKKIKSNPEDILTSLPETASKSITKTEFGTILTIFIPNK